MGRLSEQERGLALKDVDSPWTVLFIDPIVIRLLPHVRDRTAVTPLRLTVVAHLLGLACAALFATGHLVLGAIVFEARFVIDCLDGKLARLRGTTSRRGALLDSRGDKVVFTANVAALAFWAEAPWLGGGLAVAYLLAYEFLELRNGLFREAGFEKTIDRVSSRGFGAWVRRRRMYPTVTAIEVEHVVAFLTPLAASAGVDVVREVLLASAVLLAVQAIRYGIGALRAAAELDRAGG